MDSFFDMKEFIATILKRLRLFVIVTVLCAGLVAAYMAFPLVRDYMQYNPDIADENTQEVTEVKLPVTYTVSKSYRIVEDQPETLDELEIQNDRIGKIVALYAALYRSDQVTGPIADEYFDQVKKLEQDARIRLVEINYQPATTLNNTYTRENFKGCFGFSADSSYLTFSAVTYSKEVSQKMLTDYIEELYRLTNNMLSHEIEEISNSTTSANPTPATSNPRTNFETSTNVQLSIAEILKQGIKGGLLGAAFGIILSLLIAFFSNSVDVRLQDLRFFSKHNVKVIGVCSLKKKNWKGGPVRRWLDKVQGDGHPVMPIEQCCSLTREYLKQKGFKTVLLTGTIEEKQLQELCDKMSGQSGDIRYIKGGSVLKEAETLSLLGQCDAAILVEQEDRSQLKEVENEIDMFNNLDRPLLGCIVYR